MTTTTLGAVRRREAQPSLSLLTRVKAARAERRAVRDFERALYGASPSLRSDLLAAKMHSGL